ncbi:Ku protein [Streptomyces sp. NPDC002187]|uniref:non-homologous end joining protein Ku n=1 Tax=Streptomyces sp. NPDC002187 TaxID=3364637 RepID=UPI0036B51DEC
MPRPVWSGAISFGLVTIPVKVLSATEDRSISFRQIHLEDGGRIRYRKICELEDKQVGDHEIIKGYELDRDTLVPVTDEDLAGMPLPTAKAIEISAFVPAAGIDPIQIGASYYLSAEGVAAKPYKLLRQALERSSKVAVAKFAWHGRERLGLLRVRGDVIVLHAMRWPDEIRSPEELAPPPVELGDAEIDEALELMDAMTEEHMPDLTDQYRQALEEVIEAKAHGEQLPKAEREEQPAGQVVDLMAALNESVAKARAARGEDATVHDMPKPKKKTPAKKTASKRTAAKKTTSRKRAG